MDSTMRIPGDAQYRRHLPGADFSLEANTADAPDAGHFYLLQAGKVLLRSEDFSTVDAAYQRLRDAHWELQLASGEAGVRLKSAIGLLGRHPGHEAAAAVVRQDGSAADQKRLERARSKRRSQTRFVRTQGWEASALAGSSRFLTHLDAGETSWGGLWTFLAERRAGSLPVLALMRLFHSRHSRGCTVEGELGGEEAGRHPEPREWARSVGKDAGLVSEEQLRDSLATLLALGVIKPVYFEVLFALYLEARVEQQDGGDSGAESEPGQGWGAGVPGPRGRLPIRWPARLKSMPLLPDEPWFGSFSQLLDLHYGPWNQVYCRVVETEADAGA